MTNEFEKRIRSAMRLGAFSREVIYLFAEKAERPLIAAGFQVCEKAIQYGVVYGYSFHKQI